MFYIAALVELTPASAKRQEQFQNVHPWQLYGDGWPGQAGFFRWRDQLLKASRQITTTQRELNMVRTWGYSNRQQADRPMGGFTGSMRFAGDFSTFAELLGIGEIVHVGNQTAFGLGRYLLG